MGHHAYYDCKITDLLCLSSTFGYVGLAVGIGIGVVTLYRWYTWQKNLKDGAKTTLPPGSLGLPFLGETLEFLRACKANKFMEDFINLRMAKYGQVAWSGPRSHLSPQFFQNPEFDPSRFEGIGPQPFTYLPFGGGPRICPGIEFACTEMVVFLHHLVLNYEWSMIDPFEKMTMNPLPTFQKGLQLRIHKKD